jgi:hypothetical protein
MLGKFGATELICILFVTAFPIIIGLIIFKIVSKKSNGENKDQNPEKR